MAQEPSLVNKEEKKPDSSSPPRALGDGIAIQKHTPKKSPKKTPKENIDDLTLDKIEHQGISDTWKIFCSVTVSPQSDSNLQPVDQNQHCEKLTLLLIYGLKNSKTEQDYQCVAEAFNHLIQLQSLEEVIQTIYNINNVNVLSHLIKYKKLRESALSYVYYRLALSNSNNENLSIAYLHQVNWDHLDWNKLPHDIRFSAGQLTNLIQHCNKNMSATNTALLKKVASNAALVAFISASITSDFQKTWFGILSEHAREPYKSHANYQLAVVVMNDKKTAVEYLSKVDWKHLSTSALSSNVKLTPSQLIDIIKYCADNPNNASYQQLLRDIFQETVKIDAISTKSFSLAELHQLYQLRILGLERSPLFFSGIESAFTASFTNIIANVNKFHEEYCETYKNLAEVLKASYGIACSELQDVYSQNFEQDCLDLKQRINRKVDVKKNNAAEKAYNENIKLLAERRKKYLAEQEKISKTQRILQELYAASKDNPKLLSNLAYLLAYSYAKLGPAYIYAALPYLAKISSVMLVYSVPWDKDTLQAIYSQLANNDTGRECFRVLIDVILYSADKEMRAQLITSWLEDILKKAENNAVDIPRAVAELQICLNMITLLDESQNQVIYPYIAKIFERRIVTSANLRSVQQQMAEYLLKDHRFAKYIASKEMPILNMAYCADAKILPAIFKTNRLSATEIVRVLEAHSTIEVAAYKNLLLTIYSHPYFTAEKCSELLTAPEMTSTQRVAILEVAKLRRDQNSQVIFTAEQYTSILIISSRQFTKYNVNNLDELTILIPMLEKLEPRDLVNSDQNIFSEIVLNCLMGLRNCYLQEDPRQKQRVLALLKQLFELLTRKSADFVSNMMLQIFNDQEFFAQLYKDNDKGLSSLIEMLGATVFLSTVNRLRQELQNLKTTQPRSEINSQIVTLEQVLTATWPCLEGILLQSTPLVKMSDSEFQLFLSLIEESTKEKKILRLLADADLVIKLSEEKLLMLVQSLDVQQVNQLIDEHAGSVTAELVRNKITKALLSHQNFTQLDINVIALRIGAMNFSQVPERCVTKLNSHGKLREFIDIFSCARTYDLFEALPTPKGSNISQAKQLLATALLKDSAYLQQIISDYKQSGTDQKLLSLKEVKASELKLAREVENPKVDRLVEHVKTDDLHLIINSYISNENKKAHWLAASLLRQSTHVATSNPEQCERLLSLFAMLEEPPHGVQVDPSKRATEYFSNIKPLLIPYEKNPEIRYKLLCAIYSSAFIYKPAHKDRTFASQLLSLLSLTELFMIINSRQFEDARTLLDFLKEDNDFRIKLGKLKKEDGVTQVSYGAVWLLKELLKDAAWVNNQVENLSCVIDLMSTKDLLGYDYKDVLCHYLDILRAPNKDRGAELKAFDKLCTVIFVNATHVQNLNNNASLLPEIFKFCSPVVAAKIVIHHAGNLTKDNIGLLLDSILGGEKGNENDDAKWCKAFFDKLIEQQINNIPDEQIKDLSKHEQQAKDLLEKPIRDLLNYYLQQLNLDGLPHAQQQQSREAFRRIVRCLMDRNIDHALFTPEKLNGLSADLLNEFFRLLPPQSLLLVLDKIHHASGDVDKLRNNIFKLITSPTIVATFTADQLGTLIEVYIATFKPEDRQKDLKTLQAITQLRDEIIKLPENNEIRKKASTTLAKYIVKKLTSTESSSVKKAIDSKDPESLFCNKDMARIILLYAGAHTAIPEEDGSYLLAQANFGEEISSLKTSSAPNAQLLIADVSIQKMKQGIKTKYFPEGRWASPFTTTEQVLDACVEFLDPDSRLKLIKCPDCPKFSINGYRALLSHINWSDSDLSYDLILEDIIKALAAKDSPHDVDKVSAIFGVIQEKKGWPFIRKYLCTDVALLTAVLTNNVLLTNLKLTTDVVINEILTDDTFGSLLAQFGTAMPLINDHIKKKWKIYVAIDSKVNAGFFDYVFHQPDLVDWLCEQQENETDPKILAFFEAARRKGLSAKIFRDAVLEPVEKAKLIFEDNSNTDIKLVDQNKRKYHERSFPLFCLIPKFLNGYDYSDTQGSPDEETKALCDLTKKYAKEFQSGGIDNIRAACKNPSLNKNAQLAVAEALFGDSDNLKTLIMSATPKDGEKQYHKNIRAWIPTLTNYLLQNDPAGNVLKEILKKYGAEGKQQKGREAQKNLISILQQNESSMNNIHKDAVKKASDELKWQENRLNWTFIGIPFGRIIYAVGRKFNLINSRDYVASADVDVEKVTKNQHSINIQKKLSTTSALNQTTLVPLSPANPAVNSSASDYSSVPKVNESLLTFFATGGITPEVSKSEMGKIVASPPKPK